MRKGLRWLKRAVLLVGILPVVVTLAPPRWYVAWLAGPWLESKGKVLIVLAGDGIDEHMLGHTSYWRSVYAVWAWREGGFEHVLLSGARPVTEPMRTFLTAQGVPREAIVLEPRSQSTHENAEQSAHLLRSLPKPYVLMTSDFHMWRARRAFFKTGIETFPRPIPDAGKRMGKWSDRWTVFLDLIEETGKILYYKAHRWI